MDINGKRIADEGIYLNEDRYDKPKEYFKLLSKLISERAYPAPSSLLDVGCATGELLYYLKQTEPHISNFFGMDISKEMIIQASKCVPGVEFSIGSVLDEKLFRQRRYNIVTCIGVLSIFDDFAQPLKNLLSCVRDNGSVYIFSSFNDDPIDLIMRYRRSNLPNNCWETGWNIFSRNTVEDLLSKSGYELKWSWHKFRIPFAIKKRESDPMRTWTIAMEDNPYQIVNGACQMLNTQMLDIHVIKAPSR